METRRPPAKLTNILTIGVYKEPAFVIKDIAKLAKIYECKDCHHRIASSRKDCHHRFTKCCNLQRHSRTCSQGKTPIVCPGEKVEKPQTAYEKVFYPKHYASKASLLCSHLKHILLLTHRSTLFSCHMSNDLYSS